MVANMLFIIFLCDILWKRFNAIYNIIYDLKEMLKIVFAIKLLYFSWSIRGFHIDTTSFNFSVSPKRVSKQESVTFSLQFENYVDQHIKIFVEKRPFPLMKGSSNKSVSFFVFENRASYKKTSAICGNNICFGRLREKCMKEISCLSEFTLEVDNSCHQIAQSGTYQVFLQIGVPSSVEGPVKSSSKEFYSTIKSKRHNIKQNDSKKMIEFTANTRLLVNTHFKKVLLQDHDIKSSNKCRVLNQQYFCNVSCCSKHASLLNGNLFTIRWRYCIIYFCTSIDFKPKYTLDNRHIDVYISHHTAWCGIQPKANYINDVEKRSKRQAEAGAEDTIILFDWFDLGFNYVILDNDTPNFNKTYFGSGKSARGQVQAAKVIGIKNWSVFVKDNYKGDCAVLHPGTYTGSDLLLDYLIPLNNISSAQIGSFDRCISKEDTSVINETTAAKESTCDTDIRFCATWQYVLVGFCFALMGYFNCCSVYFFRGYSIRPKINREKKLQNVGLKTKRDVAILLNETLSHHPEDLFELILVAPVIASQRKLSQQGRRKSSKNRHIQFGQRMSKAKAHYKARAKMWEQWEKEHGGEKEEKPKNCCAKCSAWCFTDTGIDDEFYTVQAKMPHNIEAKNKANARRCCCFRCYSYCCDEVYNIDDDLDEEERKETPNLFCSQPPFFLKSILKSQPTSSTIQAKPSKSKCPKFCRCSLCCAGGSGSSNIDDEDIYGPDKSIPSRSHSLTTLGKNSPEENSDLKRPSSDMSIKKATQEKPKSQRHSVQSALGPKIASLNLQDKRSSAYSNLSRQNDALRNWQNPIDPHQLRYSVVPQKRKSSHFVDVILEKKRKFSTKSRKASSASHRSRKQSTFSKRSTRSTRSTHSRYNKKGSSAL